MFVLMFNSERDHAQWHFEQLSHDHVSALWKTLELDFTIMRSVQSLHASSEEFGQDQFSAFVLPLLEGHPSIRSLQWAPLVRGKDGKEHFPIEWVEPKNTNAESIGFDLASIDTCLNAICQSRDTGRFAMTAKMMLPHELGDQAAVRVFLPVYRKQAWLNMVENRRENLIGFIVAVLRLKCIAEESLSALTPAGIDVALIDDSADAHERMLYSFSSRTRILDVVSGNGRTKTPEAGGFVQILEKDVAGRRWMIVCKASPQFIADHASHIPWIAGAATLLLTGLLAAFVLRRGNTAKRLAENERKLRGILDQTFQFVGLLTPDGKLVDANKAALDFAGVRKANVVNRYFWDTVWWRHSTPLQNQLRAAVEKASAGYAVRFDATHLLPDGTQRWIDFSLKPLRDDDGRVIYLIPEGYDITEHKQAVQRQEQLIERLEDLNRLQEELISPETVEEKCAKITDAAVRMLDLDFCRIWMIRPGDLCNYNCTHAQATEEPHLCVYRDKCLHLMASSGRYTHIDGSHQRVPFGCYKIGRIASGADKKFLTNHAAADPRVHDHQWASELGLVSFAGYKLHDRDGNPIGVLAMFAKHELTDEDDAFLSNLAEIASKAILDCQAAEALRTSERQHRLFAENVSDLIWAINFSGKVLYASPSVTQNLGYSHKECLTLSLPEIMTPASFILAEKELRRIILADQRGERPDPGDIELELLRKDGSTAWCEVTYGGMYDESGKMIAIQGVSRDISARRRMEQDLRQAKEAAESATRAKSRFMARLSHEIRNHLTSILGYADLLMNPCLDQGCRDNYLVVIIRNGEHLLELINDILDLSKIEAGKYTLDARGCSLPSLLADVAEVVRPRAEQKNISLDVEYETGLPETIVTDAALLRQTLVNLTGNAVKFTERGGVRIA
ncbi:MAG: PAS domain S-box protein, partial [Pirellulaceae bacterium]|nr:PAS domain S-box protein [Pirellulaceae bacterium]